jgi:hypothetical protein
MTYHKRETNFPLGVDIHIAHRTAMQFRMAPNLLDESVFKFLVQFLFKKLSYFIPTLQEGGAIPPFGINCPPQTLSCCLGINSVFENNLLLEGLVFR